MTAPLQLAENPPQKTQWKGRVRIAIKTYWNKKLKEDASKMKSLQYLNTEICSIGFSHPVWVCGSDPIQATMAATKACLLVGRYPLTGHKCAGKKQLPLCPLCNDSPETTKHFILYCPALEEQRSSYMAQLTPLLEQHQITDHEEITKCIIDPSHACDEEDVILKMEEITRRLCHSLHNHRSILMGTGSMMSRAIKRVTNKGIAKHNKQAKRSKCQNSINATQDPPRLVPPAWGSPA